MPIAIMKVKDGRVAKYAAFDTAKEAEAHVDAFAKQYPDAFVHADETGNILDYRVDGQSLVLDLRPDSNPTARERIIARLKRDDEYRSLVAAFRDDRGLTSKQVIDLLETKFTEQIGV